MKTRILTVLLVVLQLFSFVSLAEDEGGTVVTLTREDDDGKIVQYMNISGVAEEGCENLPVTLRIIRPDSENLAGKDRYAAIHQGYVSEDLSYGFVLPFNEAEGSYEVTVKVSGKSKETITVQCYSTDELVALLSAIENDEIEAAAVASALSVNGEKLGIDTRIFSKLSDTAKVDICRAVLDAEETHKLNTFISVFEEKTAFIGISSDSSASAKQEIIDEHNGNLFDIKSSFAYEKFEAEGEGFRNKVLDGLNGEDTESSEKLVDAFVNSVLRTSIATINNNVEIGEIINLFEGLLQEENVNQFNNLSSTDKKLVCKYIEGKKKNIDTVESFSGLLEDALGKLPELRAEAVKNTSSGKGGGGGGGGGGGSAPSKRVEVQKQETEEPEKSEIIEKVYFEDLEGYEWAKESINSLKNKGITEGRTASSFAPAEAIKRGEFAKLLLTAFEYDKSEEDFFTDMSAHWAKEYVNGLAFIGIVQGTGKGFEPEAEITREDACVMIYRIMSKKLYEFNTEPGELSFKDAGEISNYAENGVAALTGIKVLNGFPDNTLGPKKSITRAEAAVLLDKVLALFQKEV